MKKIRTIELNSNGGGKVVFSPNGEIFAHRDHFSISGFIIIRNAAGDELRQLSNLPARLGPIAFSPDGSALIASDSARGILFWDTTTWSHVRTIDGDQRPIFDIAFSFDGTVIASGSFTDKTLRLWDVASGDTIAVLEMGFFALSPVDYELAIAYQNAIRFYDCWTGDLIRERQLGFEIYYPNFSPDGSLIAVTSEGTHFYLVETASGSISKEIKTHDIGIHAVFSPDGKILAAVDEGSIVTLWDVQSGEKISSDFTLSDRPYKPAFSPDGKLLICSGGGRWSYIDIWDLSE